MADEDPINTIEKLQEALNNLRGPMSQMVEGFKKILGDGVGQGIATGAEDGAKRATGFFSAAAKMLEGKIKGAASDSLIAGMKDGFKQAGLLATGFSEQLERLTGSIKIGIEKVDKDQLKTVFSNLTKFGAENAVQLLVMTKGQEQIEGLRKLVGGAEEGLFHFAKQTAETFAGFSGAGLKGERSAERFGHSISDGASLAAQSMRQLGISQEESIKLLKEMGHAGLDMNKVLGEDLIKVRMDKKGSEELDQLSAVMLLARGSGMETSEAMTTLSQATQKLGYNSANAAALFGTFRQVQQDSGLSTREVSKNLMAGADSLAMFGGNVETVASLYKSFIRTIGEGNKLLAGDVFQSVISSLAQLKMNFKAFIGMTGKSGGFGQSGVFGSALRVEEAFKTGEGLEDIMNDLKGMVETHSGGSIISKQEAFDTGQEDLYGKQRLLMQNFMPQLDDAKADKVATMWAGGTSPTTADLATGREGATQAVLATGQQVVDQTIAPLEQALNRASSVGVDWVRTMHQGYVDMGKDIQDLVKTAVVDPLISARATYMEMKEKMAGPGQGVSAEEMMAQGGIAPGVETFEQAINRTKTIESMDSAAIRLNNGGNVEDVPMPAGLRPLEPGRGGMRLRMPDVAPMQEMLNLQKTMPETTQKMQFETPDPIELRFIVDATTEGLSLRAVAGDIMTKLYPVLNYKAQRRAADDLLA